MIKITNTNPIRNTGKADKAKRTGGVTDSTFSGMLDAAGEAESAQQSAPVMPTNPVGTMLALQEVSDDDVRRKIAVKQGRMSLDALEHLRDALLSGNITTQHLTRLQSVVDKQRELIEDPELSSILDDIELRAAVELAKLERAQGIL